ncbi:MAG: hypothetical protein PHC92_00120, partial [Syntrophomonadaceae bacterium]|nr:hypothetical protein [Syntrophomonadaceae bacterium]
MFANPSAKLIWDSKNSDIEDCFYSIPKVERIYPHPLYQNNPLFSEQLDIGVSRSAATQNMFLQGDNLAVLAWLLQHGYKEKVDLIYIDPPYLSNHDYTSRIIFGYGENKQSLERSAFQDIWKNG